MFVFTIEYKAMVIISHREIFAIFFFFVNLGKKLGWELKHIAIFRKTSNISQSFIYKDIKSVVGDPFKKQKKKITKTMLW